MTTKHVVEMTKNWKKTLKKKERERERDCVCVCMYELNERPETTSSVLYGYENFSSSVRPWGKKVWGLRR